MTNTNVAEFPEHEVLPLFGGYPDAYWEQHEDTMPPSPHYALVSGRNDSTIGNIQIISNTTFSGEKDLNNYPFGTCETGAGIHQTFHRRPVVSSMDLYSPTVVMAGKGNNILGYYMFHGGHNPVNGDRTYQCRSSQTYRNDAPVTCYDFTAAVGKYGFLKPSYYYLKLINLFYNSFGDRLSSTQFFPSPIPLTGLNDMNSPRISVRANEQGEGYVFINTYIRNYELSNIKNLHLEIDLFNEKINIPSLNILTGKSIFFPLNLKMSDKNFKYITAQPLSYIKKW